MQVPVTSFGATASELSDKSRYPLFQRTVPPTSVSIFFLVQISTLFQRTVPPTSCMDIGILYMFIGILYVFGDIHCSRALFSPHRYPVYVRVNESCAWVRLLCESFIHTYHVCVCDCVFVYVYTCMYTYTLCMRNKLSFALSTSVRIPPRWNDVCTYVVCIRSYFAMFVCMYMYNAYTCTYVHTSYMHMHTYRYMYMYPTRAHICI